MDLLFLIAAGLGAVYFLNKKTGILTGGTPADQLSGAINAQGQQIVQITDQNTANIPIPGKGEQLALQSVGTVGATISGGLASSAAAAGATGTAAALGAVTAGIGVVVAIGATLLAAHNKRLAQAKDENSAMNLGVQGFDAALKIINQAYNTGQINAADATKLAKQALANFWAEVTPHIQPNRNGCSGGSNCDAVITTGNALIAKGKDSCGDYPGQAIGAACCVGCFALHQAVYGNKDGSLPGIVKVLQTGTGTTRIPKVYPSKYGGVAREAYDLTWSKTASLGSVISGIVGLN